VAGVAEGELDTFISQIGDNYSWSVLLLQEAFVRTEGIVIDGGHQVYTSTELEGGLRCPAIIVHSKCTEGIEFAGGGSRWLAVTLGNLIIISLHLPHVGRGMEAFSAVLVEVTAFLSKFPEGSKVMIGMDANVSMRTDFVYVGEATAATAHTPANGERAAALLEFLAGRNLRLVNTFGDPEGGVYTRRNWNGTCSAQIDFFGGKYRYGDRRRGRGSCLGLHLGPLACLVCSEESEVSKVCAKEAIFKELVPRCAMAG
jgi:hypothetical protein